jgi:hypothetical protein
MESVYPTPEYQYERISGVGGKVDEPQTTVRRWKLPLRLEHQLFVEVIIGFGLLAWLVSTNVLTNLVTDSMNNFFQRNYGNQNPTTIYSNEGRGLHH